MAICGGSGLKVLFDSFSFKKKNEQQPLPQLQRDPVPLQIDVLPRLVDGVFVHAACRQDGAAAALVARLAGDERPVKPQRLLAEEQGQPELLPAIPLPALAGPDGVPDVSAEFLQVLVKIVPYLRSEERRVGKECRL